MADPLTSQQRSFLMSRVKNKGTKPEIIFRRSVHAIGLRFRLDNKALPGNPDLVFVSHKIALFVHGCFWHQHGCRKISIPASNMAFWKQKLDRNIERDAENSSALIDQGWRVLIVWECALVGKRKLPLCLLLDDLGKFIFSSRVLYEISGR